MGRLGWNGRAERRVLERILALLLAFAGLAERAAGLPLLARLPVLAILGCGEAAARSFVNGMAVGAPVQVVAAAAATSPQEGHAGRLAASFRALALVLGAMLALVGRRARAPHYEAGPQDCLPVPLCEPARPNRCRTRAPPVAGEP